MSFPLLSRRRTKIVCTLGPAVANPEGVENLINAGMDMARINCSHGEPEDRARLAKLVRDASAKLGRFIPIMFDLQGPKIRIGKLAEDIPLEDGDPLVIEVGKEIGTRDKVYTSYEGFATDVNPGEIVAVDDGKLRFEVLKVEGQTVTCTTLTGGVLKQRKGINLPDTKISAPSLSEKDLADLEMAVQEQVDFVAVSFVRAASEVVDVRRRAKAMGNHNLQFISKIERPEAIKDLIGIINTSDGVMVARGDLGVEIGSHRVPMIQKEIIARSNRAGKFVITATQMLDSMMDRPVPTRAEASDVANAILDGTDACMLSGETASGKYPIESVETMARIAVESESHNVYRYRSPSFPSGSIHEIPDGISIAAYQTANLMGANLLIAFTNSGGSALTLSKKHPNTLIVGATINEYAARRMQAYWGVIPMMLNKPTTVEDMFEQVKVEVLKQGLAREGEIAVLTAGYPLWESGTTNLMRVMEL